MEPVRKRSRKKKPGKHVSARTILSILIIAFIMLGDHFMNCRAQDKSRDVFQKQQFILFMPIYEHKIEWTDIILEEKIQKMLHKDGSDIYVSDLWDCKKLVLQRVIYSFPGVVYTDGEPITDIRNLRGLANVRSLNLNENLVTDIRTVGSFKQLRYLWLDYNPIQDISPISSLTKLYHLSLNGAHISKDDLEPLSGLKNLGMLELGFNEIDSLEALRGMNIVYLSLQQNLISDIKPLTDLKHSLWYLDLSDNQIADIGPLAECAKLWRLSLRHNNIADIEPVKNLKKLENLDLHDNNIASLPDLSDMASLCYLDLSDNNITTEEWKKVKLPPRKIQVDLAGNLITDFDTEIDYPLLEIVLDGVVYKARVYKKKLICPKR